MPEIKPSENLMPLAMFGMIIVGKTAVNVANICTVTELDPHKGYTKPGYTIEMSSGLSTLLVGDDADAFRDQLQTMMRHAQFAATSPGLLKH